MKKILIAMTVVAGLYLFLGTSPAFAANLYWVGNDAAATNVATNWKTTDPAGCGSGDASAAPTTTDVAIFDADCDNGAAITGSFSVAGINMNSGYTGTVTQNAVAMTIGASGWTQAGGTFTGNSDGSSANITIGSGGDMNLTGGTFTSTNDTLTVNDDFTVNGGTFTHNSGTVTFQATADQAATVTGTMTFNTLNIQSQGCTADTYTLASGAALTVSGTLTLDSIGTCGSGGVLNGPGGINAQGNITISDNGLYGSAVITVNGTGDQTFTGANFPTTAYGFVPAMTINKSSGTITLTNTIAVTEDFTNTSGTALGGTGTLAIFPLADNAATITGSFTTVALYIYWSGSAAGTITIASGTTITVSGTTTLQDVGCCNTRSLNGPGGISAQGNITVLSDGWRGTAVITVNGTGDQTFTGISNFPTSYGLLPAMTINKSSGTITLTNTITVSDDFTNTSGTTFGGTGTLAIYPITDNTATITGSFTVPNLYVYYSGNGAGVITISSGTIVTVSGTTTFNDVGCCNTRQINGPGGITAQGDLTTGTYSWSGNLAITLSGSGNQTVNVTSNAGYYPTGTVTINKTGGTVTLGAAWSINSSGQDLLLSQGTLDMSTYNLTVNDTLSIGGTLTQGSGNVSAGTYTISQGGTWTNSSTGDITVGSGGVTNNGTINLGTEIACGGSDSIAITSSLGGTARTWTGSGTFNFYDITVSDANETPKRGRVVAWSSTNSSNSNWTFNSNCPGNPVAYWKFDDGTGTTAQDSSTNNLDGTLNNTPTWKTEDLCIAGKCLYFDGANNENISKADDSKLDFAAASNFTVSAWVRKSGAASANTVILGKASANIGSTYQGYKLYMDASGDFCFDTQDGTLAVDSACTSGVDFDNDKWHLVQGVKTGTTKIELFIDGNLRASDASIASTGSLANAGTFYTGIDSDGLAIEWLGYLDEVKVYPYARSAAQVKQDFLSGAKNAGVKIGDSVVLGAKPMDYLSNGLVGYWKMDESSWTVDCSTASVTDSSGIGNNGKSCPNSTGPAGGAAGKFGNGGSFDGSNDYVTISHNSALTPSNFTISVWVNPTTVSTDFLVNKMDYNGSVTSGYSFWVDSNAKMTLRLGNGLNQWRDATDTGASVTTTSWQHLVVTWDGTNAKFYRNNTAGGTVTPNNSGAMTNSSGALDIGRMWTSFDGGANYAAGTIDEARIYNRVFSAKEISDLYNWAPGPTGYWNFEEGTGTSANDTSGNANTGTITAGTGSFTKGKYGKGYNFDNADTVVNAGSGASLDDLPAPGMTAEAWIYPKGLGENSAGFILAKNVGTTASSGWILQMAASNAINFTVDGSTDLVRTTATSAVTSNAWNHVVVSWDGVITTASSVHIYVNGMEVSYATTTNGASRVSDASSTFYIGNDSTSAATFNGIIDEVRVYNYARSAKQIVEDMNAGHPAVGSPVGSAIAHWEFDEGYGTTANNSGSGGSTYKGTLTGSPTWTQSGRFGKALNFSGNDANQYVGNSSWVNITESVTVSAWINPSSLAQNSWVLSVAETPTSAPKPYVLGVLNNGASYFRILNASDTDVAAQGPVGGIATGSFVHLVGTYDGTTVRVYVNGIQKGSSSQSGAIKSLTTPEVVIGRNTDPNTANYDTWNGTIDEVKIYNYALTADEVKIEYNKGQSLVLGAAGTNSTYQIQAANQEYCVPGDSTSCAAPVGRWDFEEKTGQSTYDTSGNGKTGTLGADSGSSTDDPTWVSGKIGGALNFDGGDYINAGSTAIINTSSAYTISAWIKTSASGPTVYSEQNNVTYIVTLHFGLNADKAVLQHHNGSQWRQLTGNTTVNDNKWHYIVGTFSTSSGMKLYVDGKLDNSDATQNTAQTSAKQPRIGAYHADSSTITNYWNGKIDQVRIYNYARTPAQIVWDYNKGKPVGHWKLDECQGTSAYDSSGNGNTGTITIGGTGTQTTGGTCTAPTDGTGAWYNGRTGKRNYSLSFDGTDDVATVTNADPIDFDIGLKQGVSFSAWIYADSDGEGDLGQVFWKGTNTYLRTSGQSGSNLNIDASLDLATTDATKSLTAPITTGAWNHIVVTYSDDSDDEITVYVNGVNKGSSTDGSGAPASTDTNNLLIGGTTTANFDGQIDDFRVYNYELTAGQVKMLMNEGAVRFGPNTGAP